VKIVHVVNTYATVNKAENDRLQRAAWTWRRAYNDQGIFDRHVPTEALQRTSDVVLGDKRRLPFIKDMIEYIMDWSFPEKVKAYLASMKIPEPQMVSTIRDSECLIMLTNADTCLCSDVSRILADGEPLSDLIYSHRRNFTRFPKRLLSSVDIAARGDKFHGVDMVAFTPRWWMENRDRYPDLVLGCEGWDWVFKYWPGAMQAPDCVYHEYHYPPYWMAHRDSPAQRHNKREIWKWAAPRVDELIGEWPTLEEYANA
jgi:hypothetical protein